ncbi:MAG TPA: serine hydrolase [Chthoniobacteraceae bacterium]|nr:serine hydrolase [Chthoniobacteraceae bacterium]
MKPRFLLLFLISIMALSSRLPAASDGLAAAYAVADATTGHILEGRQLDKKLPIASLTKIATAMVVLDWAEKGRRDLTSSIVIPPSATRVGGANPVQFQPGDQVTMRDLLYAALLQSDNVAATALADHVGRSLTASRHNEGTPPVHLFVAQMNALARKLGMRNTRFLNPHGLDHQEHPYSTARDLVLLSSYAMQRSAFRFYVSQSERRIQRFLPTGETTEYRLVNTNELLGTRSIDGVKTGRTSRAGDCLVISAAREPESIAHADGSHTITPRRLVVVVLNARDRFGYASRLLTQGWRLYDDWAARGRPTEGKGE